MIENKKEIETTLVHEFFLCKTEFLHFFYFASILLQQPINSKEIRVKAFTSYGNFLRHLYSFYEGQIKLKNKQLLKGVKRDKEGEKISEIITNEVIKCIRAKEIIYENNSILDKREIVHFNLADISTDFGNNLRYMRNRFSHTDIKRVNKEEMTLTDFYNKYHKYIMLLYESAAFTWNLKPNLIEKYDWLEINNFLK